MLAMTRRPTPRTAESPPDSGSGWRCLAAWPGIPETRAAGWAARARPAKVIASACISVVVARLARGSIRDPWSPDDEVDVGAEAARVGHRARSRRSGNPGKGCGNSIRRWVAAFGTTWSGGPRDTAGDLQQVKRMMGTRGPRCS